MDCAGSRVRRGADPSVDAALHRGDRGVASLTVRIVAAGRTGPNRDLRFGSEGLDLDETGRRDCRRLVERFTGVPPDGDNLFCGPEASAIQTAELLGVAGAVDPALHSLDLGRWRGRLPEGIPVGELRDWFTDVSAVPHDGESITGFVARIGRWFDATLADAVGGDAVTATVVVAMPVAQALLAHVEHGGPDDFWSIAVEPASERLLSLPVDSGEDQCHSDKQN